MSDKVSDQTEYSEDIFYTHRSFPSPSLSSIPSTSLLSDRMFLDYSILSNNNDKGMYLNLKNINKKEDKKTNNYKMYKFGKYKRNLKEIREVADESSDDSYDNEKTPPSTSSRKKSFSEYNIGDDVYRRSSLRSNYDNSFVNLEGALPTTKYGEYLYPSSLSQSQAKIRANHKISSTHKFHSNSLIQQPPMRYRYPRFILYIILITLCFSFLFFFFSSPWTYILQFNACSWGFSPKIQDIYQQ
jgi:hypothetical protein